MQCSWLAIAAFCVSIAPYSSASQPDTLIEPNSRDNSGECECYLTSGPDPGYFQYYRFFDFRNIPNLDGDDFTTAPPLITNFDNSGLPVTTSAYFDTDDWQENWAIQNWTTESSEASPIQSVNSPQNIYISRNTSNGANDTTYLTLRAFREPDFMSIAEIDSNQRNLFHSSIRARMRVIPNSLANTSAAPAIGTGFAPNSARTGSNASHPVDAGAVAALFTYYNDTSESDIEILTSEAINSIWYTNQPSYNNVTNMVIPGSSTDASLNDTDASAAVGGWTDWIEHRLDWFEGVSRWYVDGQLLLNNTFNVPVEPQALIINLWGDGGDWSGNMSVGGQVLLAIEWIEIVFNISGPVGGPGSDDVDEYSSRKKRDESSLSSSSFPWHRFLRKRSDPQICHVGCNVDGVAQVGFPEVAFNSMGFSFLKQGGAASMGPVFLAAGLAAAYLLVM